MAPESEKQTASGGRRGLLATLAVIALALVALLATDLARGERVPAGVSVEGVPVGGQTRAQAEASIREGVGEPASRAIEVEHHDERYELASERSGIRVDAEGSARAAASRGTSLPGARLAGDLLGLRRAEVDLGAEVAYERSEVERFAEEVAEKVERSPRDAAIEPTASGLEVTSARPGLEVRENELLERLDLALRAPERQTVVLPVERTAPEVDDDELAQRHPQYLIVDREGFRLRLYEELEESETYRISVGDVGHDTPPGEYEISSKAENPTWYVPEDAEWAGEKAGEEIPPGPENPIKARWLGIEDGIGIHGTDETGSIGERASAGCIRMLVPEVRELYERVPVGTPVYIG